MSLEVIVLAKFKRITSSCSLNSVYGGLSKANSSTSLSRKLGELNYTTVNKHTGIVHSTHLSVSGYDAQGFTKLNFNTTSNVLDSFFLVLGRINEIVNSKELLITQEYMLGATCFSSDAIKELKILMKKSIIPIAYSYSGEVNFFDVFRDTVFAESSELFMWYVGFLSSVLMLTYSCNDKVIFNFIS